MFRHQGELVPRLSTSVQRIDFFCHETVPPLQVPRWHLYKSPLLHPRSVPQSTTMLSLTVLISVIVLGYTIYSARRTDYTTVCKQIGTSIPSVMVYYPGSPSWSSSNIVLNRRSRIPRLRRWDSSLGNFQYSTVRLRSRTCNTRGCWVNCRHGRSIISIHRAHTPISSKSWPIRGPHLL